MNKEQRKNTSKYLYDVSKGVALLSVIDNVIKQKWELPVIVLGSITVFFFFLWAYILDGGINHE
ncbi:MAG: hypothetical protein HZB37_13260 [Planctomycetes bacterium]|nr:hypothetical protein [Planctomycetota bacterium]